MLKNTKLVAMMASMLVFAGLKEPPITDGKVEFDQDASEKLKTALTEATFNKAIEAFNKDLAEANQANDIRSSVETMLKDMEVPQDKLEEIVNKSKQDNPGDLLGMIKAVETSLTSYKSEMNEKIKKLTDDPEKDTPVASIIKDNMKAIVHSATHIFSSGKDYDAISADRPWNKALAEGLDASATDFSDQTIVEKLNGDLKHFYRENPTMIKSLHRDNFDLPSFWPKRLKVDDQVADGAIVTGEITQARKFGFLPKNVQSIDAEVGQIFPIQIDAKWSGYDLQKIEASWLNFFNKEGSQPEKMSFVRFLVEELMKKARQEDRIATIKAIFVPTLDSATKGGKFINRQNGLFYLLWNFRDILQKYRPYTTIQITPENVYDYFHTNDGSGLGYLYRLPQDVRDSSNLVMYLHKDVWTWYKSKYKQLNGTNMDYKGKPEHFEDLHNIRVETLVDHTNKQFHFMTFDDNIEILENIPSEKTSYKLQSILRDIHLMGDYKLGVRLVYVGRKWDASKPEAFKVQSVWSNDAPIFADDTFIPLHDDKSGVIKMTYKNLQVDEDWQTDIVTVDELKAGQVLKIKGNTAMATSKNVVHNAAKIVLASNANFDLQSGGTLTLRVGADLKLYEITRTTTAPVTPDETFVFTDTTLDAALAVTYKYDGASAATLTEVENGFENKTIRIFGNTGAALTVANVAGNINVGTSIVLDADNEYLDLIRVDGIWYKGATGTIA